MSRALIHYRPATRWRQALWAVAGIGALIVVWEIAGRRGWLGSTFPPLSDVVDALAERDTRRLLTRSVGSTVPSAIAGFIAGVSLAMALAFFSALVPLLRPLTHRVAVLAHALPLIALAPVLVSVFGRERVPMVIAAFASFFPMFVSTMAGLESASGAHLDVVTSLGGRQGASLRFVRIPGALPMAADGLRLAAPAAVLGAVFGEWFGAERGLGVLLITAMQNFRIPLLWAAALLATVLSLLALALFAGVHRIVAERFA